MDGERTVRGQSGRLACKDLKDHGFDLESIKRWRETEYDAGRASNLNDFFIRHGLCPACRSQGVQIIGWSEPSADERQIADELNVDKLPFYEICPACAGTGAANRSEGDGEGLAI
jgi:hypothetical protein